MKETLILILCIIFIVIVFLSLRTRTPIEKKTLPEGLEERFKEYCELILAKLNLKLKEVELKRFKLLIEVPFDDGQFEFYSFDYRIEPEKAVTNSKGVVLNSTELMAQAGMKGTPILLFFRKDSEVFEVSFVEDRELAYKGYKGYVSERYANFHEWPVDDEFSIRIDNQRIRLWENLKGEAPFEKAVQTREHTQGIFGATAEYTDTWEGLQLKISTWVQFERKRELIYWIKSTSPVAETNRGIHVGSKVQELKSRYPVDLAYVEDFKGAGNCFGYIPNDGSCRYIAFFAKNGVITEIWITDGFDERPFEAPDGYVDGDIEWIEFNNDEKFSERYAREIYIGQHKADFDVDKVFQSFIAKELAGIDVVETGKISEEPGIRIYYAKCQSRDKAKKLNLEVELKRVKLENSVTGDEIWVVNRYRSQRKEVL